MFYAYEVQKPLDTYKAMFVACQEQGLPGRDNGRPKIPANSQDISIPILLKHLMKFIVSEGIP